MPKRYSNVLLTVLAAGMIAGCGNEGKQEHPRTSETAAPQIKVTGGAVKLSRDKEVSKENSGQFYYTYNKEKTQAQEEPEKVRTTIDAYLHIRSPYERVRITMLINRLSKNFSIRCAPCHDDYANGVIGPSLLGKDGDFIYKRLIAFKTGERKNVLMKELVAQIDDAELKSIADEIATFNKQIQKMREERK